MNQELSTTEAKQMKPIIFSTPMVQAILGGRKTQTRRIIKDSYNGCWTNGGPHPCPNDPVVMYPGEVIQSPIEGEPDIVIDGNKVHAHFFCSTMDKIAYCLYGKPGDILYVRETWGVFAGIEENNPYIYRADGCWNASGVDGPVHVQGNRWRPPIHMPKAAARIFLKITGISVERLKSISKEDAISEGVQFTDFGKDQWGQQARGWHVFDVTGPDQCLGTAQSAFGNLWEKINGPESWEQNPWIWKILFERIEKPTP